MTFVKIPVIAFIDLGKSFLKFNPICLAKPSIIPGKTDKEPRAAPIAVAKAVKPNNPRKPSIPFLSLGDSISVEIIGKKFELNDYKIHIVASLISKNSKSEKTIKLKRKKKKFGGGIDKNNMDIYDKQNIDLRMQIIEKYIRINQQYDGELAEVIKTLKNNIKLEIWDNMDVSDKNQKIEDCINYLEIEDNLRKSYGEKWNNLTSIDRKNLIKDKMEEKSNDSYEIKEINSSNYSSDDSSLLEV